MQDELKELFKITKRLKQAYSRSFPLDGRLVGDIGEALVKRDYAVELYPQNNKEYDAYEIGSNRKIQIKASMKYNFSFPFTHCPDYYIAVHINEDSTLEEIYNGKGEVILNYIQNKKRKGYKETYYTLTVGVLRELNKKVSNKDRIKHTIESNGSNSITG
ncbi:MAG: hypothetical protein KBB37_03190 [Bacteroidia bacterium]|nr:hypothetical protein [Bacteroidia bacterium]